MKSKQQILGFTTKSAAIWGIGILLIAGCLFWVYQESSKPLPGQKIDDLGRGHIELGKEEKYNSNPPTSGPHYADWVRAGVYESAQDDRYLVHSLEHGFIIMSYNCDKQASSGQGQGTSEVRAQELQATDSSKEASPSVTLSDNFKSGECKQLVAQLTSIYDKRNKKKLIVIPRPSLDSRIALTAWDYLDKMDSFDEARINKFIDAHFDHGPEQTME